MRSLPAVLLAAITVVPILTTAVSPPAARAVGLESGPDFAAPEAGAVRAAVLKSAPGAAFRAAAGPVATPVATKIQQLSLTGVDPGALRTLTPSMRKNCPVS